MEGKNPIYFGVIRSKVTLTINQIFDNRIVSTLTKLGHMIPLWKGKNPIYFGVIRSKVKVTITINRIFDYRVVST